MDQMTQSPAPVRSPEDVAILRDILGRAAMVLWSVPREVRLAYLDELWIRPEVHEPLLSTEVITMFTLAGMDGGE